MYVWLSVCVCVCVCVKERVNIYIGLDKKICDCKSRFWAGYCL